MAPRLDRRQKTGYNVNVKSADYLKDISLIYQVNFRSLPLAARLRGMGRLARMYYTGHYPAPISLLIAVTGRCQCNCGHCGVSYLHDQEELSQETILRILDDYRRLGGIRVIFSGGEPLLRGDLEELVRYGSRLGLTTFVDSNGIALTDGLARRLKDAGLCNLELSIDFLDGEKMAKNRRHPGVLEKVKAAIKICERHGLVFSINTVAFRESLDGDIQELIRYSRRVGASCVRVLEPIDIGKQKGQGLQLDAGERERYQALYEPGFVILEQVGKFTADCSGLNGRYLSITPDGIVEPCPYMPIPLGNITERSLGEVIRDLADKARAINRSACRCEPNSCPVNDPKFRRRHLSAVR